MGERMSMGMGWGGLYCSRWKGVGMYNMGMYNTNSDNYCKPSAEICMVNASSLLPAVYLYF